MGFPPFKNFPSPLIQKAIWPFAPPCPNLLADERKIVVRPKISIVTPSYNQGAFIEETIRSVLLQSYPNLEYIIIDGGSTDGTVDIIRKYEKWLTFWVSEPDQGQSHALNKGFSRATGEIFGYINSDDIYAEHAFLETAAIYQRFNQPDLILGDCWICNEKLVPHKNFKAAWPETLSYFLMPFGSPFPQPSAFWRSDIHQKVGGFNESLHYAFDREFFLRLGLAGVRPVLAEKIMACYRDHPSVKTRNTLKVYEESLLILEKYGRECNLSEKELLIRRRKINNDIAYHRIFKTWKFDGRTAALIHFIRHLLLHPDFLFDRKVMGLARRLVMFRANHVAELKNI